MLSKPKHGWSVFSLGDFTAEVSYLVDIPFDWLISCRNALKSNIPVSFFLELEGEHCVLVSYDYETHIIICNEEAEYTLKTIEDVDVVDLSYMLLKDVKMYFEDWVKWSPFEDTEAEYIRRQTELKELIDETEKCLSKASEKYNKE